jgi:hypothetical protein
MPKPKPTDTMQIYDGEEAARIGQLEALIRWIAPRIQRRNANGGVSDQFCILCSLGQPEFKRQPCRHAEIWAIAKD